VLFLFSLAFCFCCCLALIGVGGTYNFAPKKKPFSCCFTRAHGEKAKKNIFSHRPHSLWQMGNFQEKFFFLKKLFYFEMEIWAKKKIHKNKHIAANSVFFL
jgi:hypothetical protein